MAELIRRGSDRYRFTVVSRELAPELRTIARWERVPVPNRPFPAKYILFFFLGGLRVRRLRGALVHTQGAVVPNRADLASIHCCHRALASAGIRRGYGSLARQLNSWISLRLSLLAERWCYRPDRLGVAAAVSRGVAGEMQRFYSDVDVVVTPNGVDVTRFRPDRAVRASVRSEQGVGDEVVALFVGGDWALKGLEVAVEAVALTRRAGVNLQLWLVGAGNDRWLRDVIEKHDASLWLRILGRRGDAERYYQAADIFVLPTAYETFSLAALEAAAAALPVVATRVSGISDLIDAGGGRPVHRDPAEVARVLGDLAHSAELRSTLGGAGRRYAERHSWSRSVDAVLGVYDRTVKRREELDV